jgi:hypothetical protein
MNIPPALTGGKNVYLFLVSTDREERGIERSSLTGD